MPRSLPKLLKRSKSSNHNKFSIKNLINRSRKQKLRPHLRRPQPTRPSDRVRLRASSGVTSCETFRVHAQPTSVTARRHAWLKHPKVSAWRRACLASMSVPVKPRALGVMATVGEIDQSRVSNLSLLRLLLKHTTEVTLIKWLTVATVTQN